MEEGHRRFFDSARVKALLFRVAGHAALALIAISVPSVGPNRFWLAGIILLIGSPIAILLNLFVKERARNWVEALFDLLMVVVLIHLVPHLWVAGLCLGLMVALAPSISLHPSSHWIYLGFGVLLITGMTIVLVSNNTQGWEIAIAAVTATYPSMLYYTYTQMRRANELQQRAQMMRGMTELAGNVAHDFNNMLTSVSGHAQLASLKLANDHTAREDLTQVIEGIQRASLLSGQLLSFAGRNIAERAHLDVLSELRNMAGILTPALPAGVTIEIDEPTQPLFINADASQLHQVLMNIFLNAGEAMVDSPGSIKASLFQSPAPDGTAMGHVVLTVLDSGYGIPETAIANVFERFYTTKSTGHGIGLAATKQIMMDLGGDISINQSNPEGTEVRLKWPQVSPPSPPDILADATSTPSRHQFSNEKSDAPQSTANVSGSSGLVLIVDDDERVRLVAKRFLTELQFDVLEAINADDAESIFQRDHEKIHAVLLDLKMPGRDGWALLKDIRKINQQTKVIICSGYNPNDNPPSFTKTDPNLGFLKKPYKVDQLSTALKSDNARKI